MARLQKTGGITAKHSAIQWRKAVLWGRNAKEGIGTVLRGDESPLFPRGPFFLFFFWPMAVEWIFLVGVRCSYIDVMGSSCVVRARGGMMGPTGVIRDPL